MAEVPAPAEKVSNDRNFKEVQFDLYSLKTAPDPVKERALIIERARILNQAREIGVFETIKRHMLDIQINNPSLLTSAPLINSINPLRMEDEARGLRGWDDKFEGLLSAYKDGALRNIQLVYLKKTGSDPAQIAKLEREIDLLNWGTPPALVGSMPIEPETATSRQFGFSARELAEETARAQGIESPYKALENFLLGEEYLKPTQAIVPGSEPRFWIVLDEEERLEWEVRSTLTIAGYKKSMATGTDKLYMDEMREFAVDLNKTALKRIFRKSGVLPAVGIYQTIAGDKKFLDWKGERDLYDRSGAPNEKNLKTVFCSVTNNPTEKAALRVDFDDAVVSRLETEEDKLRKSCADSFYPHDGSWGTKIEEASFRALRNSVRYWLTTKGRRLLINDDKDLGLNTSSPEWRAKRSVEQDFARNTALKKFFGNEIGQFTNDREKSQHKQAVLTELRRRARDAEQIAWNFTYITDTIETFDSREFRPEGTMRQAPSNWWTLFQWVPMHPQERFEAKIKRTLGFDIEIQGNEGDVKTVLSGDLSTPIGEVEATNQYEILDTKFESGREFVKIEYESGATGWVSKEDIQELRDLEPKEDWSSFGAWGIYNLTHGGFRDEKGKFKMPDELKILPDTLIRGPLFTSRYEGKSQESGTLFAVFNSIGKDVLSAPDAVKQDEVFSRINWSGMSDSPFVPFIFDEMRWADVVTNVFKKGGPRESKVAERDLSEAVMNLRLNKEHRQRLLITYIAGVNPKSKGLNPVLDPIAYFGARTGFLDVAPNYFLELK